MTSDANTLPSAEPSSSWRTIAEFTVAAADEWLESVATVVAAAVQDLCLAPERLEQIVQSTVEAISRTMAQVWPTALQVKISIATPLNSRAGCWGFFLVARTPDRLSEAGGPALPAIELFLYQEHTGLRMKSD